MQDVFLGKLELQSDFCKSIFKIIDAGITDDYNTVSEKNEKLQVAIKIEEFISAKNK